MKVVYQSYDGASNMQGKEKGVVARILEECPNAKGHHCCAHNLQLSGEIVVSECPILRNHVLGFAQTLLKLLKF
jgi:flagella basal body P-ring formation protein FlgA